MKYNVSINEKSRTITVTLADGTKGVARCCPTDRFDINTGIELALERARVAKANAEKAKEDISFSDKTFKENIGDYTDIELTFRVYDSDDWSADAVALETVHVYPYGKENAETFVRNAKKSDKVLVDNDKATVILLGFEDDEIWGYTANLFIVNKSDKYAMFTVEDVSVNGYMVDPLFASDIDSGKCAFDTMSWSDEDFEESGITEVEEIEFTLRAYDNENFLADDIVNEKITINP